MRLALISILPRAARASLFLMAAIGAVGAVATMAMAQAIPSGAGTAVDISPMVNFGLELANGVLVPVLLALALGVLGWIGNFAKKLVGTNNERAQAEIDRSIAAMNAMLHSGIQRGVDALEGMTREKLFRDGKPVVFDVKSEAVAWLAQRMVAYSPDLLRKLGVTEARLRELALEAIVRKQETESIFIESLATQIAQPGDAAMAGAV